MSDLRKAAQQALEALEAGPDVDPIFAGETEAALRAALAQQPEPVQEAVAQAMQDAAVYGVGISRDGKRIDPVSIYEQPVQEAVGEMRLSEIIDGMVVPAVPAELPVGTKLYTASPQRPLLTDEEIKECLPPDAVRLPPGWAQFARAIERKVRGETE